VVTIELDYYNSLLSFTRSTEQNDEEDELVYEMPIQLDAGPVYPFVSLASKGSEVAILEGDA
jgi:hypothetical protein